MKNRISRRDFLTKIGVGFTSLAIGEILAACGQTAETPAPTQKPENQTDPTSLPKATQPPEPTRPTNTKSAPEAATAMPTDAPAATNTPQQKPYLAVARNGDPETMVKRAIAALGGMSAFVPQGSKVIIKPNICVAYYPPEYAATTNPFVVGALVKLCLEAGAASVQVMDYPFGGSPEQAYARSGIAKEVKAAGGEMVIMSGYKYKKVDLPDGKEMKKTDIYGDILTADVLINVPIAKDHGLTGLTLGMKNLLGVVADRTSFHPNYGQRLADLNTRVHSTLTVVDAVRMLMAGGPTGGDLNNVKQMDTVIASADIVAADSYATTLFGMKPEEIAYIKTGAEMGLGRSDLQNLKIEEIQVGA